MQEISQKFRLARRLMHFRRRFPTAYAFFPRSWALPAELPAFKAQFDSRSGDSRGGKVFIIKPDASCQGQRAVGATPSVLRPLSLPRLLPHEAGAEAEVLTRRPRPRHAPRTALYSTADRRTVRCVHTTTSWFRPGDLPHPQLQVARPAAALRGAGVRGRCSSFSTPGTVVHTGTHTGTHLAHDGAVRACVIALLAQVPLAAAAHRRLQVRPPRVRPRDVDRAHAHLALPRWTGE